MPGTARWASDDEVSFCALVPVDYFRQPLVFKVRKVARYVRLYGPRRTAVKVESQYHMRRRYGRLPRLDRDANRGHVGVIGCGTFGYGTIAYYVRRNRGRVLRGAMDININHAASLARRYGLAYYTTDAGEVINDPAIDLVYIASNHASHAEYAVRALEVGKSVHIEKPHVVDEAQLTRLVSAMEKSEGRVSLGFNRPKSEIGQAISAALGQAAGPAMFNWFIAGHEIPPDHWYFKPEEGGRVLGNLCHWTDFTLQMVEPASRYPIEINPTKHTSDSDICVSYLFGDGSIAAVTFSAKGHTFEGVKEVFSGHRGDVLITMRDFQDLVIDMRERRKTLSHRVRRHGHEASIMQSYAMVRPEPESRFEGVSPSYVWQTGQLFLKTREALERGESLVIERGSP